MRRGKLTSGAWSLSSFPDSLVLLGYTVSAFRKHAHSISQCQPLCMIPGCHYDDSRAHIDQSQKAQESSGLG
jgi:hypothetical protein